ncbi:MAG: (d)CMP kinase [Desulfobaccales bacterium]
MGQKIIITIDGPAGAGKSTLGRRLAQALGYRYVDSGALYRAAAWQIREARLDPGDSAALSRLLAHFQPHIVADPHGFKVSVNGREITRELRTPEVTQASSQAATQPPVRRWVGELLHRLTQDRGVVAEGRDLGSAVFPQAEVKFYLVADLAIRAARRQQEWQEQGNAPAASGALEDIAARDQRDQSRRLAPLTMPEGAHLLDTTHLNPDEVVAQCLARIRESQTAREAGI